LGSGVETTIRELAECINAATGNSTAIALAPARDWDRSGQRYAAISKARDKLGFLAQIGLQEGLRFTIGWTRENQPTILRCMMQHAYFVPNVRNYV
jgi:UDP-glucose 4-epimerase